MKLKTWLFISGCLELLEDITYKCMKKLKTIPGNSKKGHYKIHYKFSYKGYKHNVIEEFRLLIFIFWDIFDSTTNI